MGYLNSIDIYGIFIFDSIFHIIFFLSLWKFLMVLKNYLPKKKQCIKLVENMTTLVLISLSYNLI